jgi:hypothetical protein
MSCVLLLAADDKSQSDTGHLTQVGVHKNGSPKDTDPWEFECGNILDQPTALRVSLLNTTPMATANADFDPFYLRYVAFYLLI